MNEYVCMSTYILYHTRPVQHPPTLYLMNNSFLVNFQYLNVDYLLALDEF